MKKYTKCCDLNNLNFIQKFKEERGSTNEIKNKIMQALKLNSMKINLYV